MGESKRLQTILTEMEYRRPLKNVIKEYTRQSSSKVTEDKSGLPIIPLPVPTKFSEDST